MVVDLVCCGREPLEFEEAVLTVEAIFEPSEAAAAPP